MGTAEASVRHLPTGRAYFLDERDALLRTTWYPDRGFVNVSIWRGDACVATFHLAVTDTARLVSFLVEGLGEAVAELAPPPPPAPRLTAAPARAPGIAEQLSGLVHELRRSLADWIRPTR